MKTYKRKYPFGTLEIRADFAQAADSIRYRISDGEVDEYDWLTSPFQVADFRHRQEAAISSVRKWLRSERGL